MPAAAITGGASGLGLALAERCAALTMDVTLLDLAGERYVITHGDLTAAVAERSAMLSDAARAASAHPEGCADER